MNGRKRAEQPQRNEVIYEKKTSSHERVEARESREERGER